MPSFLNLPADVYLSILANAFMVEDILNLRQTCRKMYIATRDRSVWHAALRVHVLNQDMPVPRLSGPIENLSDKELERCVVRAVRLRRNWSSPTPTHHPLIRFHPLNQPATRNISSHFITGKHGKNYLLTLTLANPQWSLDCWELGTKPPRCIAHRTLPKLRGLAYNSCGESMDVVAISLHDSSVEVLSVDFDAKDPANAFTISKHLTTTFPARIPAFDGNFLLLQYQSGQLVIADLSHSNCTAELVSPTAPSETATCMAAVFTIQVAVVFRHKSIEIYDISRLIPDSIAKLHPLSNYVWQWGADKISVMALPQWPSTHSSSNLTYLPITILLRHSSIYPWPVNIIHQYTLSLSPIFDPSLPLSSKNLPYDISPIPLRSVSSPVRLTSITQMALGNYGTAVWFDSHTEEYFGPGAGQRLAGILTSLPPQSGRDEDDDEENEDEVANRTEAATAATVPQTEASSVFATRRQDVWVSIAVDEQEGRIALGCMDGSIELLEYE